MPCPFLHVNSLADAAPLLAVLQGRNEPEPAVPGKPGTEEQVTAILHRVEKEGLPAVVDFTRRFDAPAFTEAQFKVPAAALKAAFERMDPQDLAMLQQAVHNIRTYHDRQRENSWFITGEDGSIMGRRVLPVDRAGLYVPGGKAGSTPLISSLLMGAIPAQAAGVQEIAVVSPPGPDGTIHEAILAVAHLLGITEVYAAGSAWGVAALAFGAGPLAPVDVIAGPGNIYVATAKRLLLGRVGIDMIAGPSEILVIADHTANPAWAAADMLSQAEHDPIASAVCLCTDEAVAQAIHAEVARQAALLPRKDIAAHSLQKYSAVALVPNIATAVSIANAVAPEHLELLVQEPWAVMPGIRHAGAVFMGHHAAEALGDYMAGPNHVLPTMGTARFASPLGVETFCKKMSIVAPSAAFSRSNAAHVARFARMEGLEAHARSALCRGEGKE